MGLFDKIKEKLGMGGVSNEAHKPANPDLAANQHATDSIVDSQRPTTANNATTAPPVGTAPTQSTGGISAASSVDVSAKLDAMAAEHPEKLNWRTSIVDLLKLLGLDSSLESRKDMADELGCPPEKMNDSAQMNIWLHRAVMQKLAQNGGQVPPELAG
jgi:hypothetical protein